MGSGHTATLVGVPSPHLEGQPDQGGPHSEREDAYEPGEGQKANTRQDGKDHTEHDGEGATCCHRPLGRVFAITPASVHSGQLVDIESTLGVRFDGISACNKLMERGMISL